MIYIGIDNGSTGSIGILDDDRSSYICTPIKTELSYQKSVKRNVSRINYDQLYNYLLPYSTKSCRIGLERPMVNPKHFHQTCSAMRSLESTLIVFERLGISFEYIDSKAWQKILLPPVKGSAALKKASTQIGIQLFPHLEKFIKERGDADGILIAEYMRRRNEN